MITRIQQARKSSTSIIRYNEEKVARGLATPVLVKNTPFDDIPPEESPIACIFGLFEDIESNPAKSAMVRTPSFHMTANPSDTDVIDEPKVLEYIQEVMDRLGYGQQPYIVYRHNDIERQHWHVVSTKLRPDGSCIHNSFEGYALNQMQKELAEKYGFVSGKQEQAKEIDHDEILNMNGRGFPEFSAKARNKKRLIQEIVNAALEFVFASFKVFGRILESMGVRLTERKNGSGKKSFYLYGLKDGKVASNPFRLDDKTVGMIEARIEESKNVPLSETEEAAKMKVASDYVIRKSSSLDEYVSQMESIGLIASAERTPVDGITNVTIVSRRMRTALDAESGTFDIAPMNQAEKSGRWMAPHRGRKSAAEVNASRKKLNDKQRAEIRKLIEQVGRPAGKQKTQQYKR